MDPVNTAGVWLGDMIAAELTFLRKMVPLKIEAAVIELQLIWIDIKLAVRS